MRKAFVHFGDFSVITVIFYTSAPQSDKKMKDLLLPKQLKSDYQKS